MKEKLNELYKEYLDKKLDLIFYGENGISFSNNLSYVVGSPNHSPIDKHIDMLDNLTGKKLYNSAKKIARLFAKGRFDQVRDFNEGYAIVQKNDKYNFINIKGQLVSNEWYDDVCDFKEGYAAVKKDGKWNFIDKNGKLISNEWYNDVRDFKEGYAVVIEYGECNFIDIKGQLVSNEWYGYVCDFQEGYAAIEKDRQWNFVDIKNQLISDEWYDDVHDFQEGYAAVSNLFGEWNFIDKNGKLINDEWYDYVYDFQEGYAAVQKGGKWNFIDINGRLLSNEWYDDVHDFKNGVALVENNSKDYYIDSKGNTIFDSLKKTDVVYSTQNFIKINDKITCKNVDVGDYKISKTLFGYVCTNSREKIKLKYQPIKKFGFRYMLCIDNENLFLYDRISNSYQNYGNILEVSYDDNFIFDEKNDTIYLIYGNYILDVTSYYKNKLLNKAKININSGVAILSRDDFRLCNMQEIEDLLKQEEEDSKLLKEKIEKEKIAKDLETKKLQNEVNEQARKEKELTALKEIQKNLNILQQVSSIDNPPQKLKVDNIFVQVEDHLEITPFFVNMLKYIDLSLIDFKNVKIDGIDFRGCNLNFDPQVVFQKKLTNCNFEGIYIGPFINFSGVDIRGARFGNYNDPKTLNIFNGTFGKAIYDNTTIYNGVPITEFLDNDKVSGVGGINL